MALHLPDAPRFLILRRDNIGDLACTTPLVAGLRARWPRAWLGALVTTYNAEVLAGNPHLDAVLAYEKLKHRSGGLWSFLRGRLAQTRELRGRKLDVVLVPTPAAQALRIARGLKPARVLASPPTFAEGQHEVERTFDLGRELGVTGEPGPMQVQADAAAAGALRERLGAGPFTALHISARRPKQQWPVARYAALASALAAQGKVLLLWAPGARDDARHPGDDEAARAVLAAAGPQVLPVPTPDLKTLIAALSLAERVVCPDGGAMHLAAALGKPVVALFGDSPVARWRPWGVPHRVVRPASGDLADLDLAPVRQALRELGG